MDLVSQTPRPRGRGRPLFADQWTVKKKLYNKQGAGTVSKRVSPDNWGGSFFKEVRVFKE